MYLDRHRDGENKAPHSTRQQCNRTERVVGTLPLQVMTSATLKHGLLAQLPGTLSRQPLAILFLTHCYAAPCRREQYLLVGAITRPSMSALNCHCKERTGAHLMFPFYSPTFECVFLLSGSISFLSALAHCTLEKTSPSSRTTTLPSCLTHLGFHRTNVLRIGL